MIKHIWTVVCRRSIVDQSTNNLTLSEVIEQLSVDLKIEKKDENKIDKLVIPIEFDIVSFLVKEEADYDSHLEADCKIEIIDETQNVIHTLDHKVDMPAGMKRIRAISRVMGMPITGSGEYIFKVYLKEKSQKNYTVLKELPLEVTVNKQIIQSLSA